MKEGDLVRVNALGAALLPQAVEKHGYLWLVENRYSKNRIHCVSLATGHGGWWEKNELEKADVQEG